MVLVSLKSCPRCGGDVKDVKQNGVSRSCMQCGWVDYEETLCTPIGTGASSIVLQFMGREKSELEGHLIKVEIMSSQRDLILRVYCPFCEGADVVPMRRSSYSRSRWLCVLGHGAELVMVGKEYVGWA